MPGKAPQAAAAAEASSCTMDDDTLLNEIDGSSAPIPGKAPQAAAAAASSSFAAASLPAYSDLVSVAIATPVHCNDNSVAPIGPSPAPAPAAVHLPTSASLCWGVTLSGRDAGCGPGFVSGDRHFKFQFCARCHRDGLRVPASHLRVLALGTSAAAFKNTNSLSSRGAQGCWSTTGWDSPKWFRLLNHTKGCTGPVWCASTHWPRVWGESNPHSSSTTPSFSFVLIQCALQRADPVHAAARGRVRRAAPRRRCLSGTAHAVRGGPRAHRAVPNIARHSRPPALHRCGRGPTSGIRGSPHSPGGPPPLEEARPRRPCRQHPPCGAAAG